jgi:hypothetical protein
MIITEIDEPREIWSDVMESLTQLATGSARDARETALVLQRYDAPRLTAYGDLRTLTLGGSPGITDSGFVNAFPQAVIQGYQIIP